MMSGGGGGGGSGGAPAHECVMIAIHNLKGGVTKTSSTLELGYEAAKQGLRVLLVDTDMQGNLTTKFMHSRVDADGGRGGGGSGGGGEREQLDDDEEYESRYDDAFEAAGVRSSLTPGDAFRAFHHILGEFTDMDPEFTRDKLKRIQPLTPSTSHEDKNVTLHLIAGHLRTSDYDVHLVEGFKDSHRHKLPGLVTNVIREFANGGGDEAPYHLVIFDCGPYLSSVTIAVLLGVDYIVAPFKPERDCVTAADIMPLRLRDWHAAEGTKAANKAAKDARVPEVYKAREVKQRVMSAYSRKTAAAAAGEVDATLRGFPLLLGAFATVVKDQEDAPTAGDARLIRRVLDTYNTQLEELAKVVFATPKSLRPACWPATMTTKLWTNLDACFPLFISNSQSLYQQATTQKSSLPCMGTSMWRVLARLPSQCMEFCQLQHVLPATGTYANDKVGFMTEQEYTSAHERVGGKLTSAAVKLRNKPTFIATRAVKQ
jgi:cellulose biosynthesis protein BcsQ